jgi:hypothetical protein
VLASEKVPRLRSLLLFSCLALAVSGQDPYQVAGNHYHLIFENAWARASRVTYGPHETAPVHEHPPTPTTVYIYVTDGGEFRFRHITGFKVSGYTITRPAVKAGAIRFAHSAPETHSVEYLGDAPTEYVRIELRTEPLDIPIRDVRIPPAAPPVGIDPAVSTIRKEFENGQLRILRVVCAAQQACPPSQNPADPAIATVLTGPDKGAVRWSPKAERGPIEEVRIELKTSPVTPDGSR